MDGRAAFSNSTVYNDPVNSAIEIGRFHHNFAVAEKPVDHVENHGQKLYKWR